MGAPGTPRELCSNASLASPPPAPQSNPPTCPHSPTCCHWQVGIRLSPFGGFLDGSDSHPYALTTYLLEELNK